ncbi:complex I subunit 5 family protein [Roseococcus thiosulfatophilus]|uniref:complex I subunit 5 family protein n=1 Tax=Roseococcus thiosulfatophilus TaxID=35813 RepID=UPI001A901B09|nr:proton-conducting transporter membrane subunit [Roseococcus thiosulfatophilus]
MTTLLLSLPVALPLLAALLAVAASRQAAGLAMATGFLVLGLSVWLAFEVAAAGPITIALGGWEAPLGIVLRADGLGAGFLVVSAMVMAVVLVAAQPSFEDQGQESRAGFAFWPLALLLFAGLNTAFLSRDLFNLFVALELLTLSAIALVAIEGKAGSVTAALRYMVFALLGSVLFLLGAALAYAAHATLDIGLLAQVELGWPMAAALALMTMGLAIKTALFPFHAWLPPAHAGAPAPASAMLSALVPKASFVILLRLWFDLAPELASPLLLAVLGGLGAVAVIHGSLLAIGQDRLKLIIAYSTVAQLGYLFLVFPLAGGAGGAQPWSAGAWTAASFHAFAHMLAKAAMFLAAGLFLRAVGHDRLEGLRGLARAMPIACFAFGLSAISLMGLPLSGGFTAKYLLLTSAFASGQWGWGLVLVAGGLLAAIYLFRPLNLMFSKEGAAASLTPVPRWEQVLPLLLALAAVLLGLFSAGPFAFLQIGRPGAAAEGLLP